MGPADRVGAILVTGACGHIGRELCRILRNNDREILPVDLDHHKTREVVRCDLRSPSDVSQLFQAHPIRAVIHLAGTLPSAFRADPLTGADVNLGGSCELLRQSAAAHVRRFIFASSMSVYGSSPTRRPVTEDDPPTPDEPYGASKLAVELIGQTLAREKTLEFVALRIARVVGPGIKKTSSPWRSQIFEACPQGYSVSVRFTPEAILSLVHVEDVAHMLFTLAETAEMSSFVYNTPVEIWEARHLKEAIEELRGIRVELGSEAAHGGPICDGSRFAREFGFQLSGLRDRLSGCVPSNRASFA
ncbi:MAG TPA: NAD(P)-dependent oxidoreductase [Candidatus Acidoferrum sp.]|jgi:nucleoside-diphosphate-sugar epimerase|nr:NAD(P)-dependent oxidoreductase [Candidatus Acidoferrum sp.]